MHDHPFISRISHAITVAGKWAAVFGVALFVFFFATILMVRGDGTAPAVTHLSNAVIEFTGDLLGVSPEKAVISAAVIWSLVVFAVGGVMSLLFAAPASIRTDQAAWPWSLGIVVIVMGAVMFLIRTHAPRDTVVDERALAVEFVSHNADVMRAVGGEGEASLLGYSQAQGEPATYEIAVYGTNTLYAIVEVSGNSPTPKFRLVCTTPLSPGQRDPSKHPCEDE